MRARRLVSGCLVAVALAACTDGAAPGPAGSAAPGTAGTSPPGTAGTASPAAGEPSAGAAGTAQGPERTGERVRVVDGGEQAYSFEVFAQDAVGGLCLELRDSDGGESLGCGFEVPERQDVGFYVHQGRGSDGAHGVVVGSVVSAASTVRVEFASGGPVTAPVRPVPGLGSGAFGLDVGPREDVTGVVALAADGREVGRRPA